LSSHQRAKIQIRLLWPHGLLTNKIPVLFININTINTHHIKIKYKIFEKPSWSFEIRKHVFFMCFWLKVDFRFFLIKTVHCAPTCCALHYYAKIFYCSHFLDYVFHCVGFFYFCPQNDGINEISPLKLSGNGMEKHLFSLKKKV
jgi:hypothetical protein